MPGKVETVLTATRRLGALLTAAALLLPAAGCPPTGPTRRHRGPPPTTAPKASAAAARAAARAALLRDLPACERDAPARDLTLGDWALPDVGAVGYVALGLLHQRRAKLLLYDLRRRKPRRRQVATRAPGRPLVFEAGLAVVGRFAGGNVNRLGGHFGAFARAPATAELTLDTPPRDSSTLDTSAGARRRALTFDYRAEARGGFAGFWVHLYDAGAPPAERAYLDVRGASWLTFEIRGARGGEAMQLKIGDRRWELKGDSMPVGPLTTFLPARRITRAWQRAWVPLSRLPRGLDRRELATLVWLALPARGREVGQRVFVRDIAFARSKRVAWPPARVSIPEAAKRPRGRAMWLWKTRELAADSKAIAALAGFCRQQNIGDLFLQLPYTRRGDKVVIERRALGPLLRALNTAGVRVDALDGDPRLALRESHPRVLATIAAVIDYNRGAPAGERFAGVRYDNEPYLLPSFGGRRRRQAIYRQYLELVRKAAALAASAGLRFGVDIPFWFDGRDRFDEPVALVDGQPLSHLVIDAVDNLAIMAYRTRAYGLDGVIAHAADELAHASRRGKRVFVGLETVDLPDETLQDFAAAAGERGGPVVVLRRLKRGAPGAARLAWIGRSAWTGACRAAAKAASDRVGPLKVLGRTWVLKVPASKLTFHDKRPADLARVMVESRRTLAREPSFAGFAIHSYESYRPWLAR